MSTSFFRKGFVVFVVLCLCCGIFGFFWTLELPKKSLLELSETLMTNGEAESSSLDELSIFNDSIENVPLDTYPENLTKKTFVIPKTFEERKEIYRQFYNKFSPNVSVNCQEIVAGNKVEIKTALDTLQSYQRQAPSKDRYMNLKDCDAFKKERGYIEHPLTKEELDFPIAFGLLVYKKYEQIDRLLRLIYRPQHFYCIHVDLKGTDDTNDTFEVLNSISKCFSNIFVVQDRVDVSWGKFSIVQAELRCLKYLWDGAKGWKYYINLTGQE